MINETLKKHSLKGFHIPSNWMVAKNMLLDKGLELLDEYKKEEHFLIKENFFSDNIFYATSQTDIEAIPIKGVIDVYCICGKKSLSYELTLSVYKGLKKGKNIYTKEQKAYSLDELCESLNELFALYSYEIINKLCKEGIDTKI
ncbi:MAG: hypothetical protein OIF32_12585 [Campylobacterales bacterium]|nr:hypothetical protein [Campylobacterales bacterium]